MMIHKVNMHLFKCVPLTKVLVIKNLLEIKKNVCFLHILSVVIFDCITHGFKLVRDHDYMMIMNDSATAIMQTLRNPLHFFHCNLQVFREEY